MVLIVGGIDILNCLSNIFDTKIDINFGKNVITPPQYLKYLNH